MLYSQQTQAEALAHVASMQADMGGTELLHPLSALMAIPPRPGFARQVLVLTDGQVSNSEAVINLVARNARHQRVFALGLGHGARLVVSHGWMHGWMESWME